MTASHFSSASASNPTRYCIYGSDTALFPWLAAIGVFPVSIHSEEAGKDFDVLLIPGTGDLTSLQKVQSLGRLYPKKPIVLLLTEADDDQETAAIELGAFEVWDPDTKFAAALARLKNQLTMLRHSSSANGMSPRKRVHSPFLRRKQRLLQTLLSVVERPEEFRAFVQEFFQTVESAKKAQTIEPALFIRLGSQSQQWGLDFLYKKLSATSGADDLKQADQDLRTFIKTHEKLLEPILHEQDLQS